MLNGINILMLILFYKMLIKKSYPFLFLQKFIIKILKKKK